MTDQWLAERFQEHRPRLRAVAYQMLGSQTEADDAVQDTWLRLFRTDIDEVDNLAGWLTTVVARVSLNMLRARQTRLEKTTESLPDPIISRESGADPEAQAVLADSVSLALLVVLETLGPAERLAFVLHDLFQLPFDEIAPLIHRTEAARQLAGRARRRVAGADVPATVGDTTQQRQVLDAFFRAAQSGEFHDLVAVLHPNVVLRTDFGGRRAAAPKVFNGSTQVARQAKIGALPGSVLHPVLVNGLPGVVVTVRGRPFAILGFTVTGNQITAIDAIADPDRVGRLAANVLD